VTYQELGHCYLKLNELQYHMKVNIYFADYISFCRTSSMSLQVSLEVIKVVKDDSQE